MLALSLLERVLRVFSLLLCCFESCSVQLAAARSLLRPTPKVKTLEGTPELYCILPIRNMVSASRGSQKGMQLQPNDEQD